MAAGPDHHTLSLKGGGPVAVGGSRRQHYPELRPDPAENIKRGVSPPPAPFSSIRTPVVDFVFSGVTGQSSYSNAKVRQVFIIVLDASRFQDNYG